jgi:hypothetical protein
MSKPCRHDGPCEQGTQLAPCCLSCCHSTPRSAALTFIWAYGRTCIRYHPSVKRMPWNNNTLSGCDRVGRPGQEGKAGQSAWCASLRVACQVLRRTNRLCTRQHSAVPYLDTFIRHIDTSSKPAPGVSSSNIPLRSQYWHTPIKPHWDRRSVNRTGLLPPPSLHYTSRRPIIHHRPALPRCPCGTRPEQPIPNSHTLVSRKWDQLTKHVTTMGSTAMVARRIKCTMP